MLNAYTCSLHIIKRELTRVDARRRALVWPGVDARSENAALQQSSVQHGCLSGRGLHSVGTFWLLLLIYSIPVISKFHLVQ